MKSEKEFNFIEWLYSYGRKDKDFVKVSEVNKKFKEFIRLLKEDNAEGIRMIIKMYPHKSGEELASEIIEYLNDKVMWRRAGEKLK